MKIHDKNFKLFIKKEQIENTVNIIADKINVLNQIYKEEQVIISMLNGSFMFTSDLCKRLDCLPEVQFVKLKSYEGTQSTGNIQEVIGLTASLKNKTVYIVEDIVDSGLTLDKLIKVVKKQNPARIFIVTLFYKPNSCKVSFEDPVIIGRRIGDEFIVGYGLDYNEKGRNLQDIYIVE